MGGIEPFVIFAVTPFHFSVVPGSERPDQFVSDAVLFQMDLEHSGFIPIGSEAVGEFSPIIGLDAFDRAGEGFYQMIQKHSGRISIVFFKSLNETPAGEFVDGSVLEKLFANDLAVFQTGKGDEFHVNLNTLPRIIHLLIGFRDVFGVRWFYSHNTLFSEETIQSRNRAGIAPLPELDPEDDQSGVRISAAHISDQRELLRGMLIRVVMRFSGAFPKGFNGAVIASFPAVDVLPVGLVFNSSFRDAILLSKTN